MFRNNRCCERPSNYNQQMSYPNATTYNQSNMENIPYQASSPIMMGPSAPIYECAQERVCHKEFIHEVPHICPINTRVINHHIYKHTYTPCYTCCEENEVSNVYDGCCCKF